MRNDLLYMIKPQHNEQFDDFLDRVEKVRKRHKDDFDELTEEEQQEQLDLDYLAGILIEAYLDTVKDKELEAD